MSHVTNGPHTISKENKQFISPTPIDKQSFSKTITLVRVLTTGFKTRNYKHDTNSLTIITQIYSIHNYFVSFQHQISY